MKRKNVEIGTYEGVKANASDILSVTTQPGAIMPPDTAGQWSAERTQTFNNWIRNGFPLGTATPVTSTGGETPARLRKDVTTLTDAEFELLTTAFTGLMGRDPSDPNSYFALAGAHGLPKLWCEHHIDRFNPWHRYYLGLFEDALRSVPGCADVTLPYWDIATDLPERLQQPPLDGYVLPRDPGADADPPQSGYFPYTTQRYPVAQIAQNVQQLDVLGDIATSLTQSLWGRYNVGGYQNFSIQAHDGGHVAVGPTMADQNVSSYDPVFWFYHCNLDRLWLSWQTRVGGTTLNGFRSTLGTNTAWLTSSLLGYPTVKAEQTIQTDVTYDRLDVPAPAEVTMENTAGSIPAARSFAIKSSNPVSVRVKGINRLDIPGAFVVNLLADGEPIAKRAFFQPINPRECPTCAAVDVVNIDFRLPHEQIVDKTLSVRIEVPSHADEIGAAFPLSRAGNPTVNARLLVEDA